MNKKVEWFYSSKYGSYKEITYNVRDTQHCLQKANELLLYNRNWCFNYRNVHFCGVDQKVCH